jgi:hypothetical protein
MVKRKAKMKNMLSRAEALKRLPPAVQAAYRLECMFETAMDAIRHIDDIADACCDDCKCTEAQCRDVECPARKILDITERMLRDPAEVRNGNDTYHNDG